MFKYLFFLFLLAYTISSQPLEIGINTDIGIINKNQDFSLSGEIQLLYNVNKSFSVGTVLGLKITDLADKFDNYSGVIYKYGFVTFFYPFNTSVKPFVGFSLNYNINSLESGGNNPYGSYSILNSLGYEIIIGLQNNPKKNIKLNFGIKYKSQEPKIKLISDNNQLNKDFESRVQISSFNLFASLTFILWDKKIEFKEIKNQIS